MLIKIGDTIYNPVDQPILVILSEQDKKLIRSMDKGNHCYCSYDDKKHTVEEIREWISKKIVPAPPAPPAPPVSVCIKESDGG